jgi:hypothetical protein
MKMLERELDQVIKQRDALAEALRHLITAVTFKAPPVEFSPGNPCWEARVPVGFVDQARSALAAVEGEK